MALKSFPGRSFRKTRNSGTFRHISFCFLSMASTRKEVTNKVFGPLEQPKSAMPTLSPKKLTQSLAIAPSMIGLALIMDVLYTNICRVKNMHVRNIP